MKSDSRVERRATQRAHEPRRLHRSPVGKKDAAPEDRRADPLGDRVRSERLRLLFCADLTRRGDRVVNRRVLSGGSRHHHQPALAQPHIVGQGANRRQDALARARKLDRTFAAEKRHELGERRPVAVREAAVAAARTRPAGLRLDEHDVEARLALLDRERGPQAGEPTTDDADVRGPRAFQPTRRLVEARLVPPPRHCLQCRLEDVRALLARPITPHRE